MLDSIFIESRLLDPGVADTGVTIFGTKLKTPVFCLAVSRPNYMTDSDMVELIRGIGKAGAMMTLGIGGSEI